MHPGTVVTLTTARASAILYACSLALLLIGPRHDRLARLSWTFGCALLCVHVAAAFQFVHHWSHAEALRFTAEQSARLTGARAGWGIYLNYLLMLVWAGDCAWWWFAGINAYRARRRAFTFVIHGFLLFMVLNATVVFAPAITRGVSLCLLAALLSIALARQLPAHPEGTARASRFGEPHD